MWNPFRRREAKTSSLDILLARIAGMRTSSGMRVDADRALGNTTVLRCATLLGNGCQQIPCKLYKSEDDGATRQLVKASEHPVARILTRRPNRWMTPGGFRRTLTMHAALSDFGIAIKTIGTRGRLLELLPVNPGWVAWKQDDNWETTFRVTWPNGQVDTFGQSDVFILRGPSWDSVSGLSAVKFAREAIGLRMAIDESQGKLFANGMRTQGFLKSAMPIPEKETRDRIVAAWLDAYGGTDNHGKTPLLEGDLDFKELTQKNTDLETMALRGQQVDEICRAFGIFPQMVGHSGDKSPTFASASQFFLAHVTHTLMPWHVEWEEAIATQLLTDDEVDAGYYARFQVQALLRGTPTERAEFYERMTRISALSPNEVRALEERDAKPELARYQIPANTTVLASDGTPAPLANKPPAAPPGA